MKVWCYDHVTVTVNIHFLHPFLKCKLAIHAHKCNTILYKSNISPQVEVLQFMINILQN